MLKQSGKGVPVAALQVDRVVASEKPVKGLAFPSARGLIQHTNPIHCAELKSLQPLNYLRPFIVWTLNADLAYPNSDIWS